MLEGPAAQDRIEREIVETRAARGYLDTVLEVVAKQVIHVARTRTVEGRRRQAAEVLDIRRQGPDAEARMGDLDSAGAPGNAHDGMFEVLEAFDHAQTRDEVLDALLDGLAWAYERAAIFLERGAVLEGWRSACRGPAVEVATLAFPLTLDSPLTRALDHPGSHLLNPHGGGLFGTGVAATFAGPIRVVGRTIGVAYAESGKTVPVEVVRLRAGFVCLLMDVASRHLGRVSVPLSEPESAPQRCPQPPSASTPSCPGPARQAPRIRVEEGFQITVQGHPAQLINVSSRGAQVVVEQRVRPNQRLTVILPYKASQIVCKAKIVWARFEQPTNGQSRYRAGLEFVEVEAPAIAAFVAYCGQNAPTKVDAPMVDEATAPRCRVG